MVSGLVFFAGRGGVAGITRGLAVVLALSAVAPSFPSMALERTAASPVPRGEKDIQTTLGSSVQDSVTALANELNLPCTASDGSQKKHGDTWVQGCNGGAVGSITYTCVHGIPAIQTLSCVSVSNNVEGVNISTPSQNAVMTSCFPVIFSNCNCPWGGTCLCASDRVTRSCPGLPKPSYTFRSTGTGTVLDVVAPSCNGAGTQDVICMVGLNCPC